MELPSGNKILLGLGQSSRVKEGRVRNLGGKERRVVWGRGGREEGSRAGKRRKIVRRESWKTMSRIPGSWARGHLPPGVSVVRWNNREEENNYLKGFIRRARVYFKENFFKLIIGDLEVYVPKMGLQQDNGQKSLKDYHLGLDFQLSLKKKKRRERKRKVEKLQGRTNRGQRGRSRMHGQLR